MLLVATALASPTSVLAQPKAAPPAHDAAPDLDKLRAQLQAAPSAKTQLAVADALFRLGRAMEAMAAYEEAQKTYGDKLSKADKALVEGRLKELAKKLGTVTVRVNEAGAEVKIDGQVVGTSPIAAPLQVAAGHHEVSVTKAGFAPFAGAADVPGEGAASVEANLAPLPGRVVVHASGAEGLRVVVDGVDVGPAPWEGDLPAGKHQIAGRSSVAVAPGQTVDLQGGGKVTVELAAVSTAAHVQVRTSDGQGAIYLDGVNKGIGAISVDVTSGSHTVVVSREDYKRFEKTLDLKEQQLWAETVTLEPNVSLKSLVTTPGERAYEGVYGGFGLVGLFGIGGMGTTLETSCSTLGAASCDTPSPNGGGLFGFVGWTWNPVGFELFAAYDGDFAQQSAHYNQPVTSATGNPLASPGRDEKFYVIRSGGIIALRVRGSTQWEKIRLTAAGGVGVAIKEMGVERDATATDGSGASDKFTAGPVTYTGAALSVELAAHYRVSPNVAISLGAEMLADNASMAGSTTVGPESGHALVSGSLVTPIPTPQYTLASGPQVFLGPFLGMVFGP
jgi:hypothetical protein